MSWRSSASLQSVHRPMAGMALSPSRTWASSIPSPCATRGFQAAEFAEVADVIALALQSSFDPAALSARVRDLAGRYPLYPSL